MAKPDWIIDAPKDSQSVTPDWQRLATPHIEGVETRETRWVGCANGGVLELVRSEWLADGGVISQVFLRVLDPGGISAWHAHARTTDRLFCIQGRAQIVLYDARTESPSRAVVAEHIVSSDRPTLFIVPPGVFHGVRTLGPAAAVLVNMVDHAYAYADPDHWRLPPDAAEIPYRFK